MKNDCDRRTPAGIFEGTFESRSYNNNNTITVTRRAVFRVKTYRIETECNLASLRKKNNVGYNNNNNNNGVPIRIGRTRRHVHDDDN